MTPPKLRQARLSGQAIEWASRAIGRRVAGPTGWGELEASLKRLYFLQRWVDEAGPAVREELTPRSLCHADLRNVIADLNPVLRGWGQYFRTLPQPDRRVGLPQAQDAA